MCDEMENFAVDWEKETTSGGQYDYKNKRKREWREEAFVQTEEPAGGKMLQDWQVIRCAESYSTSRALCGGRDDASCAA